MAPSILVVTTVHHPLDARIWQRQITKLLGAGWSVTYAAPFRARNVKVPRVKNLRCVDLPRAHNLRRLRSLCAARKEISRGARAHDLVLIHDFELLFAVGKASNVVWDVHEDTPAAIVAKPWIPKPFQRLVGALAARTERHFESRVRLLLAEDGYKKRFTRSHPVVLNAVDVPDRPDGELQPRIVYLGTVTMERGASELAELGRRVSPKMRLEIIGPAHGEAADVLQKAEEAGFLKWHGFTPSQEALKILPGAVAGVSLLHDFPNYRHSMPTKIIEYMAHGVPAVSTPLPVAVELINEADGILVPFEDAQTAANAILGLWDDGVRARKIALSAYEHVLERYDWKRLGAEFEQTLRAWADSERSGED